MAPALKIQLATLASNKALFAALEEFAESQNKENLVAFMVADTTDAEKAVREYLVPGAPKELKLSKAIFAAATKAVAPRWSEMGPAIDAARVQIEKLINSDSLTRFATSKSYVDYKAKHTSAPVQPTAADLRRDKKILALAVAHAKSEMNDENLEFLFFKGDPEAIYNRFISDASPRQINLPAPVFAMFHKVVAPDKAGCAAVVREARAAITTYINKTLMPLFVQSDVFVETVAKSGKIGNPEKAAKLLGIKNVGLLKKGAALNFAGDTKGAEKIFKQLSKEERLPQLLAALEESGLV